MTQPVVLLVEPNPRVAEMIQEAIRPIAQVYHHLDFASARRLLGTMHVDFVISNLRLGAFNGLHLTYAASATTPARGIVYTDAREPALAQDVRRAGAFYEVTDRLPVTLTAYLSGNLPPADRRDPATPDRRMPFRGGRRIWDRQLLSVFA
jgi:response regulator of citrate/malate metabolism